MSEFFDEAFAEEEQQGFEQGEAPEFPEELVQPLQELAVVGHLSDTFTYGGQEFVIRTLTIGEELEALRAAKKYDDLAATAGGRVYATAMVAGSVQSLNGSPLVLPISEKQDVASLRFRKVLDWYWPVIEAVYFRYAKLEEKQKEVLDGLEATLENESDDDQESPDALG